MMILIFKVVTVILVLAYIFLKEPKERSKNYTEV